MITKISQKKFYSYANENMIDNDKRLFKLFDDPYYISMCSQYQLPLKEGGVLAHIDASTGKNPKWVELGDKSLKMIDVWGRSVIGGGQYRKGFVKVYFNVYVVTCKDDKFLLIFTKYEDEYRVIDKYYLINGYDVLLNFFKNNGIVSILSMAK